MLTLKFNEFPTGNVAGAEMNVNEVPTEYLMALETVLIVSFKTILYCTVYTHLKI